MGHLRVSIGRWFLLHGTGGVGRGRRAALKHRGAPQRVLGAGHAYGEYRGRGLEGRGRGLWGLGLKQPAMGIKLQLVTYTYL